MILTAFGVGLTTYVSLEPKFWNGDDSHLGIGKAQAFPKFWLKELDLRPETKPHIRRFEEFYHIWGRPPG